jgi:hypothetical protein
LALNDNKTYWISTILSDMDIETFIQLVKMNQAERAKISILPMLGPFIIKIVIAVTV